MEESIVSIIGAFGMPVLVVLIVSVCGYLKNSKRYHLAEVIVQSGQKVPESLFDPKDKMPSPIVKLQCGLVWLAVGLGCLLFAVFEHRMSGYIGLAAIPMLIGVAYIITYFVMRRQMPETEADKADKAE